MEAAPIVVDGVMYLTGYDGWVWALDARTGQGAVALQARVAVRHLAVLPAT